MANFNVFERKFASLLSKNPAIKGIAKNIYQRVNFLIYKKKYNFKSKFNLDVIDDCKNETFFGYYDNNPRKGDFELFHSTSIPTTLNPLDTLGLQEPCFVVVKNVKNDSILLKVETSAFNWQQGSKLQWISDSNIIFNDIVDNSIRAKVVNVFTKDEEILEHPVYDSYYNDFYLSLDYRPLSFLRPDYAYFSREAWGNIDFKNQSIIKVNYNRSSEVVIDLVTLNKKFPLNFNADYSSQKFNHIMISKDGVNAVFLHRAYTSNGVRVDRLFIVNINDPSKLDLISDSGMISHYCWVDSNTLLAYMKHNGINGYYFIEVFKKNFIRVDISELDKYGDGHPTYIGDGLFITDTYPDKSRMKHLLLVDTNLNQVKMIAEFFEPLKYNNQTRCDLHPKWDPEFNCIYVDSVHGGSRRMYKVNFNYEK
ncbi:hypothetical protein L1D22_06240 [Vibrio sp. Isolate34]|uniref:hypothetical protein n=1 Tax=Vibrio sp. Isolate34 TaxID=2908540 RepID=UPI001EFC5D28|nr:hypothetical protein [Vibrio sp. Isolate34]MCG9639514.1 hypothetical protein [Vibrio sp. Isolate34]